MNRMIGADVAELRTLAAQFDSSAGRLRAQAGNVGRGIQISAWVGPVAVRFRHTWASEHSVRLNHAAVSLERAAVSLRQNAAEQEAASGSLAARAGRDVVAAGKAARSDGVGIGALAKHAVPWLVGAVAVGGAVVMDGIPLATDVGGVLSELAGKAAPTLGPFFKVAGKVMAPIAIGMGIYEMYQGFQARDGYKVADGYISYALGVAAVTAMVAFPPAGLAIGIVSVVWGVASIASGDTPVTKRIVDVGKVAADGARKAADSAANAVRDGANAASRAVTDGAHKLASSLSRLPIPKFGW